MTVAAEPFDPWELADTILSDVRDPYAVLAEARRAGAVQPGIPYDDGSLTGRGISVFTTYTHDAAAAVLRDPDTFSSDIYAFVMGVVTGRTILEMAGEEHRVHRLLLTPVFRRKMLSRWRTEVVEEVVDDLVDGFVARGHADLVREFTFAFPVRVISRILGLPERDHPRFARWSLELLSLSRDLERAQAASAALKDYFAGVLAERRRDPQPDLVTELANAEIDGERLTDDEIFAFLRLLLPAGVETTYRSAGNLLHALLHDREQLDLVRADRDLVPVAIEEALRHEPPILFVVRRVTRDVDLGGVSVPADAVVSVGIGAANRDPAAHPDPDTFDVRRPAGAHLTFGHGPHLCLGMHLARMETQVAVDTLLDRLPDLRLDPARAEEAQIAGVFFRSPLALPVVWG